MRLYEIDKALEEAFERAIDPETGEIINDDAMAELEQLDMARDDKIENTAHYYMNLLSDADQLRKEAARLTEKARVLERRAETLKNYLSYSLDGAPFKKGTVAISFRKSISVMVDNIKSLPEKFLRYKDPEPDKVAIKLALKLDPTSVPGAQLIETKNIQIK